ncbi:hypothetical protein ACFL0V_05330 [Nanoarchaeota archaeon]
MLEETAVVNEASGKKKLMLVFLICGGALIGFILDRAFGFSKGVTMFAVSTTVNPVNTLFSLIVALFVVAICITGVYLIWR